MKTIEVRGLVKQYPGRGGATALDGVTLAAEANEYVVVLGPAGSGKTTLLRAIAGFERVTEGDVVIGGFRVNGLPPRLRRVGLIVPSLALYPHKTVRANIEFPLRAELMPRAMRHRKVHWAAEMLDVADALDRRPHQLTERQRRRVALARAAVREPAAILIDEPFACLEQGERAAARDDLTRFQRHMSCTVVHATRDHGEAMGLADRIAVLSKGRLHQVGPPRGVYDDPADTVVAALTGAPPMNLVTHGDRLIGFRPEHLLPAENVDPDTRVTMSMRVDRIEFISGDRFVHGEISRIGLPTPVVARLPATVTTPLTAGRTHEFAVPGDRLLFFDAEYGTRATAVRLGR
jgi:multiple sugar transport system ATP-binding protein